MRVWNGMSGVVLGLVVCVIALISGSGCASYTNVPEAGRAGEAENVNAWGTRSVMVAAISEVVREHPARDAQGRYVVNFPIGTTREQALRVIQDLPGGAMLPDEGGAQGAPVYHVARLWLRASSAKVDVVFPGLQVRDSMGERTTVERAVTVWLRGGPLPWEVQRLQYWAPGVVTTPELYVPVWGDDAEAARRAQRSADRERALEEPRINPVEEPVGDEGESEPDVVERDGVLYRQVDD